MDSECKILSPALARGGFFSLQPLTKKFLRLKLVFVKFGALICIIAQFWIVITIDLIIVMSRFIWMILVLQIYSWMKLIPLGYIDSGSWDKVFLLLLLLVILIAFFFFLLSSFNKKLRVKMLLNYSLWTLSFKFF